MKDDETYPEQNALMDPLDHTIFVVIVREVTPPCQHVGVIEHFLTQAMLRLVKGPCANVYTGTEMLSDAFGDRRVHPRGIDGRTAGARCSCRFSPSQS